MSTVCVTTDRVPAGLCGTRVGVAWPSAAVPGLRPCLVTVCQAACKPRKGELKDTFARVLICDYPNAIVSAHRYGVRYELTLRQS